MRRWPQLQLDGVGLTCFEPTSGFADPVQTVESLVRSEIRRRRGEDALRAYLDGLRAKAAIRVSEKLP